MNWYNLRSLARIARATTHGYNRTLGILEKVAWAVNDLGVSDPQAARAFRARVDSSYDEGQRILEKSKRSLIANVTVLEKTIGTGYGVVVAGAQHFCSKGGVQGSCHLGGGMST